MTIERRYFPSGATKGICFVLCGIAGFFDLNILNYVSVCMLEVNLCCSAISPSWESVESRDPNLDRFLPSSSTRKGKSKLTDNPIAYMLSMDLHVQTATRPMQCSEPTTDGTIHDLPPELLIVIFHLALAIHQLSAKSHYTSLVHLMRVCKAWLAIIVDSPDFWTIIDSSDPKYEARLARSREVPLMVKYDRLHHYLPGTREFQDVVLQQAHRWVSLDVYLRSLDPMKLFLKAQASVLDRCSIQTQWNTGQIMDVFSELPRRLRHLELKRASLRDWISLQGLQSIKLEDISDPHLSSQQLLSFIQACPHLETLDLDLLRLDDRAPFTPPRTRLTLFTLNTIHFSRLSPNMCDQIFGSISAPNWTTFTFTQIYPEAPHYTLFDETSRNDFLAPSMTATVASATQDIRLTLGEGRNVLDFEVESGRDGHGDSKKSIMKIETGAMGVFLVHWLIPLLETYLDPSTGISLSIHLSKTLVQEREVSDALPRLLSKATALALTDYDCLATDVLVRALSSPRADGRWISPRMSRIVLNHGVTEGTDLLQMVDARRQAYLEGVASHRHDADAYATPVNLESLTLRTCHPSVMDDSTFEAIKVIVGPGASWETQESPEGGWLVDAVEFPEIGIEPDSMDGFASDLMSLLQ